MDRKQRVLKADLTDISSEVNAYLESTAALNSSVLYVGAELPFNHKYFDITTANAADKTLSSVAFWSGNSWITAVDVKDGTAAAGKSLAQPGSISWARDPSLAGWGCQLDSNNIPALAGTRIFNLYWCRFTWSNGDGAAVCNYVGERFSSDADLFSIYSTLRNTTLMAAYKSGKTDWDDQAFAAADEIVQYLRRAGLVVRREQILDGSLYRVASIHKTAQIAFTGIGNGYIEAAANAEARFKLAMDVKYHELDRDGSGDLSHSEKTIRTSWGSR